MKMNLRPKRLPQSSAGAGPERGDAVRPIDGDFDEFVRTIAVLRGPDGCPWDRAQDHMSLRRNMIEEAYEAVSAIEAGDDRELAEELGDVLLQVVLHAQIAADDGRFTIDDVVAGIAEKIRRRHPHVFADAEAGTPDEVIERWDAIKRDEKAGSGVLEGIPSALPALLWAQKISRRAVGVGFEWESLEAVWEKVHEEIDELKETTPGSPEAADEIGDLLFTVVNLARKQGIDAEESLRATCRKFIARFEDMEHAAGSGGRAMNDLDITEMEELWRIAKSREEPRS
jgi:tetrapyrrole methylase family protein / MazG family protein